MRHIGWIFIGILFADGCALQIPIGNLLGDGGTVDAAHTCAGGTVGQLSSVGECCSEWISCQTGLTCQPDGPVYPGSLGSCQSTTTGDDAGVSDAGSSSSSSDLGHMCVGGTVGNQSPKGGCCSEWIPCQLQLTCQPDGPVYPGSLGICE